MELEACLEAYATAADAKNGPLATILIILTKGSHPIEQGGKTSGRSSKLR